MEEMSYNPREMTIENVEIKNGKYLVKFPFLEIPVEIGDTYYQNYFQPKS
jgi:hypothetical protein